MNALRILLWMKASEKKKYKQNYKLKKKNNFKKHKFKMKMNKYALTDDIYLKEKSLKPKKKL